MIRFFVNRELSDKLAIRLSKWKRWSREFLPPDPLGGLQSGYARQYTLDQAFTVFLGGHLVADRHFPISEAKTILKDLAAWIASRKSSWTEKSQHGSDEATLVYIFRQRARASGEVTFAYLERRRLWDEPWQQAGGDARHEVYVEQSIPVSASNPGTVKSTGMDKMNARVLYVSRLYERFRTLL